MERAEGLRRAQLWLLKNKEEIKEAVERLIISSSLRLKGSFKNNFDFLVDILTF